MESLWLSGRASERGIRRSEVRFLVKTQNFFFVPHSWQDEKNIILDIRGLSRSRPSPLAMRDTHFFARGKIWDSRGKICRDLSGTYAISATPLTDLAPALLAPHLQHSRGQRIARAKALILRALSWALCKLDVDVRNLSMSLENRRKTSTKLFTVTAFFLKQNMFKFFFTALLYQKLNKT